MREAEDLLDSMKLLAHIHAQWVAKLEDDVLASEIHGKENLYAKGRLKGHLMTVTDLALILAEDPTDEKSLASTSKLILDEGRARWFERRQSF